MSVDITAAVATLAPPPGASVRARNQCCPQAAPAVKQEVQELCGASLETEGLESRVLTADILFSLTEEPPTPRLLVPLEL